MKKHWIEVCFKDVVDKVSTVKYKLKQKEYSEIGSFPVVDQGKDLIGGYTDKEELVLKCSLPVIVFGDHTKAVKLINFKFVPGADGTKVLLPKSIVVPSFLSFYTKILTQKIEDKGYARHYQQIENQVIFLPPLPEQRAIVARIEELFSELDHAIANLKSAQAKLEIYRQAVLKKAFEGNKDWVISEVGKIAKVKGGKRLPKGHAYSEDITKYPYLRVVDFGNQTIIEGNLKYLNVETQKLISRYTISSEDVYISIAGTIGRVGSIPKKLSGSNLTENAAKITEIQGVDSRYLVWFLSSRYAQDQIREKTIATTQPKLALYRIEKIGIKFPFDIVIQKEIVQEIESRLSVADKLAETIQTNLLKSESLRQSILKQAFEGKLLTEAELEACRTEADWEPAEKLLERIIQEKNKSKKL